MTTDKIQTMKVKTDNNKTRPIIEQGKQKETEENILLITISINYSSQTILILMLIWFLWLFL